MGTILVIEDEDAIRSNILEMLEDEGFEALGAENGLMGVLWSQDNIPDLVICDVMMPELDGHGVLMALRSNPATELVPFVFLSAKAAKSDLRQGMNLGADDYMTKPFTKRELLDTVQAQLKKHASLAAHIQGMKGAGFPMDSLLQLPLGNTPGEILWSFFRQLRGSVVRIKTALHMLDADQGGDNTLVYLDILQQESMAEPKLLRDYVNSSSFLSQKTKQLLREHRLV